MTLNLNPLCGWRNLVANKFAKRMVQILQDWLTMPGDKLLDYVQDEPLPKPTTAVHFVMRLNLMTIIRSRCVHQPK